MDKKEPAKKPVVIKDNKLPDGQTFADLLRTPPSSNEEGSQPVETSVPPPIESESVTTSSESKPEIDAKPKPFVYDEFWNSLPEEGRGEILRRYNQDLSNYQNDVNKNLQEAYGDLYDDEFLKTIAGNKPLQKKLKKLSDKKLQEWFEIAYEQYEQTGTGTGSQEQSQSSLPKEVREELNELKEWKQTQERTKTEEAQNAVIAKAQQDYHNRRVQDAQAVKSEYPELQWKVEGDTAFKLGDVIHKYAEAESQRQQRYVSYKEAYEELRTLQAGRPANQPAIPNTSDSGPPNQPQAPMNMVDSKKQFLKKYRTFDDVAQAVAGKSSKN